MPSLRDMILAADDVRTRAVEVPEWGATIYVRALTAGQRDRYDRSRTNRPEFWDDIRAELVVLTACDESGKLLFTRDDIPAISAKSSDAVQRVFEASAKFSRLIPDEGDDPGKASEATPAASTSSDSPSGSAG